ncbi:hypothetical protein PVOR_20584 [Paenibacillus vortex V453]|jgi:hypothetical protein|uniref:Uncharacterized protein n=1 Tax=Paenibacillus vortex V453 TaxID=715225 RepID=A0A2R9SQT0_9BACL|nr:MULTISPECIES: hypothetical protein [Paenibacillus]EFU39735.1 hypothetical protein PVOR_20584 [Paenibacillus vortex V453]ETT42843.1 hypothetical protein C169_02997 [Paenibacillus sp. FSL R5-808]MDH6670659.1 hypothetical protein [Paenibacillus sp. LBL]
MSETNHNGNQPTKAEVQTTKLNKMPVPGEFDTEFSAEEAAEVFEQQQPHAENNSENQQ